MSGCSFDFKNIPRTNYNIVLDIDETLLHSFQDMTGFRKLGIYERPEAYDIFSRSFLLSLDDVGTPRGTGEVTEMWGIRRPYLDEFLCFCSHYFDKVVVWSAGIKPYVEQVVTNIFSSHTQPDYVLSRESCVGDSYAKPIAKLAEIDDSLSSINLSNTFIIDDRIDSFIRHNPDNGLEIPAFNPSRASLDDLRKNDQALLELMEWFMSPDVINAEDVRSLNKVGIFTY